MSQTLRVISQRGGDMATTETREEGFLRSIREAGNWMPVSPEMVQRLLKIIVESGERFTEEEAMLDLIYWADKGKFKPVRYYAERWKWGKSVVQRMIDSVQKVDKMCGTKWGQSGDKVGTKNVDSVQETKVRGTNAGQTRDKRGTVLPDSYSDTDNTSSISEDSPPPKQQQKNIFKKLAEEIYQAYPRKVAKQPALKSIQKVLKSGVDPEELLGKVRRFAEYWKERHRHEGTLHQYCPMPTTFFNQGRYDDDQSEWVYTPPQPTTTHTQRRHEPTITRTII